MSRKTKILIAASMIVLALAALLVCNFIHARNASAKNALIDDLRQTNSN
jgi:hypothetical protein